MSLNTWFYGIKMFFGAILTNDLQRAIYYCQLLKLSKGI